MSSVTPHGRHALVIGGSMAGLLAARVLSDHFEQVTLVERDRFLEEPAPRVGVPQSRHVHILLARGRLILEQLFPGLGQEMIAAGAHELDVAADVAWLMPAGWGVPFHSGRAALASSRELLECMVRRRVAVLRRVRMLGARGDRAATG
jgi:2-polyprenyl-6-methoxyphenol hydroxylase-like FAD-dependent oxidoreductase